MFILNARGLRSIRLDSIEPRATRDVVGPFTYVMQETKIIQRVGKRFDAAGIKAGRWRGCGGDVGVGIDGWG